MSISLNSTMGGEEQRSPLSNIKREESMLMRKVELLEAFLRNGGAGFPSYTKIDILMRD